jgi:hypothetical protein
LLALSCSVSFCLGALCPCSPAQFFVYPDGWSECYHAHVRVAGRCAIRPIPHHPSFWPGHVCSGKKLDNKDDEDD